MNSRPSVKVFSYPDNKYRKIHSRYKKRQQAAKKRRLPQEKKPNHSGKKSYKVRPVSENPEISARYSRSYRKLEANLKIIENEREWFQWQQEWQHYEDLMEYTNWIDSGIEREQVELEQQERQHQQDIEDKKRKERQHQQDIEDKKRKEAKKRHEATARKLQPEVVDQVALDANLAYQKQSIIDTITTLLDQANTYQYYQYNKGGAIEIRLEY